MINLMPTEERRQLQAARTNSTLLRYTLIIIIAGAFLSLVLGGSYFLLTLTKTSSEQLIEANNTRADVYAETQAELDSLSSNLSESKIVLDQQLSYAKALQTIGSLLPSGVVAKEIALTPSSFDGTTPTTIELYAKNREVTASIAQQFSSSSYFSKVTFDKVTEGSGITGYPVTATLTLTINRSIAL